MAKETEKTSNPRQETGSDMVSISVPENLAEAVRQFVRQLESDDEDTRAHMLSLLTTTQTTTDDQLTIRKRIDKTTPL